MSETFLFCGALGLVVEYQLQPMNTRATFLHDDLFCNGTLFETVLTILDVKVTLCTILEVNCGTLTN